MLDDWQQWLLRESLGERRDGTWSAFECAVIMGRQNGKNAVLEARELAGVVLFGDDLITHTAHRADTTLEHFRRMERYADEFDEFRRLVKHVSHKNGDESIELKGNRRIKFISRARQPGRGFSGSCVVFDEALYLDPAAIGAIVPTLATRPMAQVWYTSSAPKRTSANLHAVIARGRGSEPDDRLFFAEWGNEVGTDLDDVDGWYRSNPGLGIRITEEYIRAERRLMSGDPELEGEFRRERVGIAEALPDGGVSIILNWNELLAPSSTIESNLQWALAVSPVELGPQWSSIGKAGRTASGEVHVEWVEHRAGTHWIVDRCKAHAADAKLTDVPLRVHASGPEGAFIAALREAGVDVDEVSSADVTKATGALLAAATGAPDDGVPPSLVHIGQASLTKAVHGAVLRSTTDGAVSLSQKSSKVEISPLKAVTVAFGGVSEPVGVDPMSQIF